MSYLICSRDAFMAHGMLTNKSRTIVVDHQVFIYAIDGEPHILHLHGSMGYNNYTVQAYG